MLYWISQQSLSAILIIKPQDNDRGDIANEPKSPNRWQSNSFQPKSCQWSHGVCWTNTAEVGH